LANFFNVKGEATSHNGGSDALTTSQVYYKLRNYIHYDDYIKQESKSLNIIWGLGKGFDLLKSDTGKTGLG